MKYNLFTLSNGSRLILVPSKDTKAASDYLITQTVDSSSVDYKGTTGTLS